MNSIETSKAMLSSEATEIVNCQKIQILFENLDKIFSVAQKLANPFKIMPYIMLHLQGPQKLAAKLEKRVCITMQWESINSSSGKVLTTNQSRGKATVFNKI